MKTMRVDPIACNGSGLCAELLPERIQLDDWGYPIVDPTPLTADLEAHARRAVAECPLLALHLDPARAGESEGPATRKRVASNAPAGEPRARFVGFRS